jgi:hypothetical protein
MAIRALAALGFSALAFSACTPGDILGQDGQAEGARYVPNYSLSPPSHRADLPCGSDDPNQLCLAVKYVAFTDAAGNAVLSASEVDANIQIINSTWEQCGFSFTLDSYSSVAPSSVGLPFQPSQEDELSGMRARLASDTALLVATTGQWVGELGAGSANAWAVLPGQGPFGVVVEQGAGGYANLIAHELGHYLNLDHVDDVYNVMNPTIYSNSINLSDAQCREARATAISYWARMLR